MKKTLLAIGIVALFIVMAFVPVGASLEAKPSENEEQNLEAEPSENEKQNPEAEPSENEGQGEPEGVFTQFWVFGFIGGELEIEEIESCEQIGNSNWYHNVIITGYAPLTPFGVGDFSVGRWAWRAYGGEDITLKVSLLNTQVELEEGKTVDFFRTQGFCIHVTILDDE